MKNKMGEFCGQLNTPCFMVNPETCPNLDRALAGEYRRKVTPDGQVLEAIDEVHPFEDVVDGAGMLVISEFPMGFGDRDDDDFKKPRRPKVPWGRPGGNSKWGN